MIFCYNKIFSSINKMLGCCSKIFGCSNKKIFVVPYFVAVTKPFFPCTVTRRLRCKFLGSLTLIRLSYDLT